MPKITKKKFRKLKIDSHDLNIVNILIKTALEKATREKKQKVPSEDKKSYKVIKEDFELNVNGGYGTISKEYGITPKNSYIDYGKLFSYLGTFRAKQPYENMAEHLGALNKATESGSFALADKETMDKIGRYEKYVKSPVMDMPIMALSHVPLPGFSSAEWEEIKMLMKFDSATYTLKTKTA